MDDAPLDHDPIIASFGLGIDSMGVLEGLRKRGIRPDAIIFADTGSEKRETYAYLPIVEKWLAAIGFPALTILRKRTKDGQTLSLEQHALRTRRLVAFAYGGASCSLKFKGDRIDAHVARLPIVQKAWAEGRKCIRIVGYDDSPADRRRAKSATENRARLLSPETAAKLAALEALGPSKDAKALRAQIDRARRDDAHNVWWYPLQEWHWTRADCVREILDAGLPLPPKSACFFCPAIRPHELVELALTDLDAAYRILVMETLAMPSHRRDAGLWRSAVKGCFTGKGGVQKSTGATAKPLYMSVYLLDWMATGEAFDRWMPQLDRKGTAAETAAMEHVGALYRDGHLRVLARTEPSLDELAILREKGRLASLALRERAVADGLLVDGRFVLFSDPMEIKQRAAEAAWTVARRLHPGDVLRAKTKAGHVIEEAAA